MKEGFHWNHAVGFLLILLAVFSYSKMGLTHLGFSLSSTDTAYKIIPDAAKDI